MTAPSEIPSACDFFDFSLPQARFSFQHTSHPTMMMSRGVFELVRLRARNCGMQACDVATERSEGTL
jgi:hypothetical protein